MKRMLPKFRASKPMLIGLFLVILGIAFLASYTLSKQPVTAKVDCKGVCVSLLEKEASPSTITVTPGTYVQFNSADGKAHSLSLGGGGGEHEHNGSFSSGTFEADEAWRVQFKEEGSYTFHDHYNPNINVLVVVYTPGKSYKIQ